MKLRVREMQSADSRHIVSYFVDADETYLEGMGADKSKLPERDDWIRKLEMELVKKYENKEYYYIIWLLDDEPVGHSNINNIRFGDSATMHLHLWWSDRRRGGIGQEFLKMTIPIYFKNFQLKKLICEPYSENIAPNKTLPKLGFEFIRSYETIPGWINFRQVVNRYELTSTQLNSLHKGS